MERAWANVRRNRSAAGLDRITIADVEGYGVTLLLDELAAELNSPLRLGGGWTAATRRCWLWRSRRSAADGPTMRGPSVHL